MRPVSAAVYNRVPNRCDRQAIWSIWVQAPLRRVFIEHDLVRITTSTGDTFANRMADEYLFRVNMFRGVFGMAKPKVREDWQIEWVHVDLTPEQKGQYRAWDVDDEDVMMLWAEALSGGYKVNTAYNVSNSQFSTSIICRIEGHANVGMGVTGYANDLVNSIRVAFFKATVVLPPAWSLYAPAGGDDVG